MNHSLRKHAETQTRIANVASNRPHLPTTPPNALSLPSDAALFVPPGSALAPGVPDAVFDEVGDPNVFAAASKLKQAVGSGKSVENTVYASLPATSIALTPSSATTPTASSTSDVRCVRLLKNPSSAPSRPVLLLEGMASGSHLELTLATWATVAEI